MRTMANRKDATVTTVEKEDLFFPRGPGDCPVVKFINLETKKSANTYRVVSRQLGALCWRCAMWKPFREFSYNTNLVSWELSKGLRRCCRDCEIKITDYTFDERGKFWRDEGHWKVERVSLFKEESDEQSILNRTSISSDIGNEDYDAFVNEQQRQDEVVTTAYTDEGKFLGDSIHRLSFNPKR